VPYAETVRQERIDVIAILRAERTNPICGIDGLHSAANDPPLESSLKKLAEPEKPSGETDPNEEFALDGEIWDARTSCWKDRKISGVATPR
jgi:hypothetical protein